MVGVMTALFLVSCRGGAPSKEEGGASGSTGSDSSSASGVAQVAAPVRAQLDSGTAAYRTGHFQDARDHYQRAVEMNPHLAASWFGVYMAETKLGDSVAADTALERARSLDPSLSSAQAHTRINPHESAGDSPHGSP